MAGGGRGSAYEMGPGPGAGGAASVHGGRKLSCRLSVGRCLPHSVKQGVGGFVTAARRLPLQSFTYDVQEYCSLRTGAVSIWVFFLSVCIE